MIPDRPSVARRIVGFHEDGEHQWVADLECGHTQHVRHDPPWQQRPWVLSDEGRRGFLGAELPCVICATPQRIDLAAPVVDALEEALRTAVLTADVNALDGLIAEDLFFVVHTGALADKAMDLAAHRSGGLRVTQLDPSEQRVHLLGDAAVVSVRMQMSGVFEGTPFSGAYRYLRVWARRGARWQIVAGQMTAVME
jgi:ketosteroid isomerase-like protein